MSRADRMCFRPRMRRLAIAIPLAAVLTLGILTARADDESDRHELMSRIEQELNGIRSDLDRVESSSSTSEIDDSIEIAARVRDDAERLRDVKGDDADAADIAEHYPDIAGRYIGAAHALAQLADAEHKQREAKLADRCTDAARALDGDVRAILDADDPDGASKLRERGKALASSLGEELRKLADGKSAIGSLHYQAVEFSDDLRGWRDVMSSLHHAGDAVATAWSKDLDDAQKACGELAKGEANPTIADAIKKLEERTGSDGSAFKDRAEAWVKEARDIYLLDCKDMQEMWDAYCAQEYEANEDPEDDAVRSKSDEIVARQKSKIDDVLAKLPPLEQAQVKLAAKAATRDLAREYGEKFQKEKGRLTRLKTREWRGNNNPALQFARAYGVKKHEEMTGSDRCDVADKPGYPGIGRGRPDCVVVQGDGQCWVFEYKPKDFAGNNRVDEYVRAVNEYYTDKMHSGDAPDGELGGRAFQDKIEASCRVDKDKDKKDDEIVFRPDTKYYDRCAQKYECEAE